MERITTAKSAEGLRVGDWVEITGLFRPWYVRLWHWLIRKKPAKFVITHAGSTTFTITSDDRPSL